jgi:transposase-like protein
MFKDGMKTKTYQRYQCNNGHIFKLRDSNNFFDNSFIEYAVIAYLRSLSLNTTLNLLRIYYEQNILTKPTLLKFVETVADRLPSLDEIDALYHPRRSGYLAFDGVWYKYRGLNFVLLVCFDPKTFDIVSYGVFDKECFDSYQKLIAKTLPKLKEIQIKGLYCDGDRGLIKALKFNFPLVPIQVCVVHKEFRLGQLLPFKRAYTGKTLDRKFKEKVVFFKETTEVIIYAPTKQKAEENFVKLQQFMKGETDEKLKKAYGSLKYNFKYILTHFDHPKMERDNNIIEGFNSIIKRRLKLLKGFKKPVNIERYLKLILLDYRFHELLSSRLKERRKLTPLELTQVVLPPYYNFIKLLRQTFHLSFAT